MTIESQRAFTKSGDPKAIANEVRFLSELAHTGYVPRVLSAAGNESVQMEYVEAEPVTDADAFLVECCNALKVLHQHGIVHGDLTDRNIIVRNNRPIMIDFAESRYAHEPGADKRPEGDAYWLWQAYIGLTGDPRRHARRWLGIRERLKAAGDWMVSDMGCNRGDMVLMAQADGYSAKGIDLLVDGFITQPCFTGNVMLAEWGRGATLLLAVLPYLIAQAGMDAVEAKMRDDPWRRLYVECQVYGDGPGPEQFKAPEDARDWLAQFGTVSEVVRIPLEDRGVDRVTWEVAR